MEKPIQKDTVTTQLLDRCQPSGRENPADLRRRNMTEAKIFFVKINVGNQGPSASLCSLSHLAQEIAAFERRYQ